LPDKHLFMGVSGPLFHSFLCTYLANLELLRVWWFHFHGSFPTFCSWNCL